MALLCSWSFTLVLLSTSVVASAIPEYSGNLFISACWDRRSLSLATETLLGAVQVVEILDMSIFDLSILGRWILDANDSIG